MHAPLVNGINIYKIIGIKRTPQHKKKCQNKNVTDFTSKLGHQSNIKPIYSICGYVYVRHTKKLIKIYCFFKKYEKEIVHTRMKVSVCQRL